MNAPPPEFKGPLFVVGLGRSGTKLLAELLDGHPQINLSPIESHFIPALIRRFGSPPPFADAATFQQFVDALQNTTLSENYQDRSLTPEYIQQHADLNSWASIFEAVIKYYAPRPEDADSIWGEKTPEYVNQTALLKSLYPQAKFLHIVRDPRDNVLSFRNSWGRNIYRAAENWRISMENIRRKTSDLGDDYLEVHYEDLISDARSSLEQVCAFLGIEFTESMLKLRHSVEGTGAAKGKQEILNSNSGKYLDQFTLKEIQRIESIIGPIMIDMGYTPTTSAPFKPLTPIENVMYVMLDRLAIIRDKARRRGFVRGLRYAMKSYEQRQS